MKQPKTISDSDLNWEAVLVHLSSQKSKFRNPDDYPQAIDALFKNINDENDLLQKLDGIIITKKLLLRIIDWKFSKLSKKS